MGNGGTWIVDAEDPLKLLLAVAVGGMIGLEREVRDKPAGFRTMILIALGSTLFTVFSIRLGAATRWDPARIAAQIVTGVGFLGAGAILRAGRQVTGLTTAAAIWLVASLGIGVGMGQYGTTLVAGVAVLGVLLVFARVERWLELHRRVHRYELALAPDAVDRVQALVAEVGAKLRQPLVTKRRDGPRLSFHAVASAAQHDTLARRLAADGGVRELSRD